MIPTLRKYFSICALVVLPTAIAACGGGTTQTTATPSPAGGIAKAGAPASSIKAGASDSTVKATGGGEFCRQVADAVNTAVRSATDQNAGSSDALRKNYQDAKKKLNSTLDSAPSEIRGDLRTLFDASMALGDELAKVNFDMTKMQPSAANSFNSPAVQAASTHVAAYVKDHCGFDFAHPA